MTERGLFNGDGDAGKNAEENGEEDAPAARYIPRTVRPDMFKVGSVALGTLQCSLIVAIDAQKRHTRHPAWKIARRTLAAWLNDTSWHRHTFELTPSGPWHKIAESLYKHGILTLGTVHEHEQGARSPGYDLTDYGQALVDLLKHIVPKPLTGKQYKEFIDRQKTLSQRGRKVD